MKVYTRTGDGGESSLYNGERRKKDDAIFEALGATDELNAQIGLCRAHISAGSAAQENLCNELDDIMSRLFDVGSAVATPRGSASDAKLTRTAFGDQHASLLEKAIDSMDAALPPLKNFILPSGGVAAAQLHVARTFARRAERRVVPLVSDGIVEKSVGVYLNRLSDYLFVAARYAAKAQGEEEIVYKKERQ